MSTTDKSTIMLLKVTYLRTEGINDNMLMGMFCNHSMNTGVDFCRKCGVIYAEIV